MGFSKFRILYRILTLVPVPKNSGVIILQLVKLCLGVHMLCMLTASFPYFGPLEPDFVRERGFAHDCVRD